MKKVIVLILMLAFALSLVACDKASAEEGGTKARFVIVEEDVVGPWANGLITVDTETGVMYVLASSYNAGMFSVLLDADGTPMLHPDYIK